ncbi:hypothetical protein C8R44DRAFT_893978 [Mycena epipterygia]|nr:hypothetical protein C8R44DRAFT_893978 [Mycena epipterygia]
MRCIRRAPRFCPVHGSHNLPANTTPPRFHQAHDVQTCHGVAPAPSHSYLLYASAPPLTKWSPDSSAPLVSRSLSLLPSRTESATHLLPQRRRSSPYHIHHIPDPSGSRARKDDMCDSILTGLRSSTPSALHADSLSRHAGLVLFLKSTRS